jgi:hypothetical protein
MPFDENIRPDIQEVLSTSALLEISEYRVFQLAYERWHGSGAPARVMENIYARYMFKEEVPPWVRQYTREVLDLARTGQLDRAALGAEPDDVPDAESLAHGRRSLAITLVVLGILLYISLLSATSLQDLFPWVRDCLLPPCY